jgi:hypothetical protein
MEDVQFFSDFSDLVISCDPSGLPSGKHTKNYGKSPFSMGKSTINGHFQ